MDNTVHDAQRLKELQALPLERKILISQTRIIEWYQHWKGHVCVSYSGGKDSTVLLHLVRQIYPDVPAVFSNTGLEYPEIQAFVRQQENVEIIRPAMRFNEVITKYGYPLIGKEIAEAIYYARRIRRENNRQKENRNTGKPNIKEQHYLETDRRRNDFEEKHQHTPETQLWGGRTGTTTNRKRGTDTVSEDSQPG